MKDLEMNGGSEASNGADAVSSGEDSDADNTMDTNTNGNKNGQSDAESSEGSKGEEEDYQPESDDEAQAESAAENARSSSDDDVPLSARVKKEVKSEPPATPQKNTKIKKERASASESEDDMPLSQRKPPKKSSSSVSKRVKEESSDDDYDDYKPQKKKSKPVSNSKPVSRTKNDKKPTNSHKAKKEKKEEAPVWKWWEESEQMNKEGIKWRTLTHQGPLFPISYVPLPKHVKFSYNGEHMILSADTEESAVFYAPLIDHEYSTKAVFNKNFMHDWRKIMTPEERTKITELSKCDFRKIRDHILEEREKRRTLSKEQKQEIKAQKDAEQEMYGMATMDGYPQKIANFRIEPPGVFRGRGDHPKMGKLKKRLTPADVIINCTKGKAPAPPPGSKWKEVRCDNTVTWLASWTENVLGQNKYIMLNPSSRIKGEKDWQKYEMARKLKKRVGDIRRKMQEDWKSREMKIRQISVALYFIDKLALRAGNEKDEDSADTVGCCSLRVEHIKLHDKKKDMENVVEFDFLGKDSIRYQNEVAVDKRVYKNLKYFVESKKPDDNLFDRLNTTIMNKHLQDLMPGLTAKVFRTYNASSTLQEQLKKNTRSNDSLVDKLLAYNRANREVAVLCNHQRAAPKTHEKSMENLHAKIRVKKDELADAKKELEKARGQKDKEKAEKKVASKKEQMKKLKFARTDKEENKTIALGTSKLNYLDPRISVAWCKKFEVPIEKIFNKTQREKFQWAIDMATPDYEF